MFARKNISVLLLCSTAMVNGALLMASPALAQDFGVVHDGSIDPTLFNPAGSTIEGHNTGVFNDTGPLILTNAGTIRGNGAADTLSTPPDAGVIITGAGSSVDNSGLISGAGFGISTAYSFNPVTGRLEGLAIGTTVDNSGTIIGDTNDGVRLIGGGTVTNSGLIAGRLGTFADGVSMFRYHPLGSLPVDDQDTSGQTTIGTVVNQAGGTIEGNRFGVILSGGGTVDNAGTITGTDTFDFGFGPFNGAAILIQGDGVTQNKIGAVTNSGTLVGGDGVHFGSELVDSTLTNSGIIEGTVGSGVRNSSPGPLTLINLSGGSIRGEAIVGAGILHTSSGLLTIDNQAGATISGGWGIYSPDGTLVLYNAGLVEGTESAGIGIGGDNSHIINSGTIYGRHTGIQTDGSFGPDIADLGGATGTLIENGGTIIGELSDAVRLVGGGTVTNSGLLSGQGEIFSQGIRMTAFDGQDTSETTIIGTVANTATGTIEGTQYGVLLTGGGVVENEGTITGIGTFEFEGGTFLGAGVVIDTLVGDPVGRTASLTNSGIIRGGQGVRFGGDGFFVGDEIAEAFLVNSGLIEGTAEHGFTMGSQGSLTLFNSGTIIGAAGGIRGGRGTMILDNSGSIRGDGITLNGGSSNGIGVSIRGAATQVDNSGSISGASFGISTLFSSNPDTGQLEGLAIGTTVDNSGSIIGDSNHGVRLIGGGTVTNSGLIAGRLGTFADGILMIAYPGFGGAQPQDTSGQSTIGTVVNQAGGTIEGNRFGVILSGGGTVDNAGTITGTDTFDFGVGPFNGAAVLIQGDGVTQNKTAFVANSGTLVGGDGVRFAFELVASSLTNSGTIDGTVGAGVLNGSPGAFTLVNLPGGTITGAQNGVLSQAGGSIVNAGSITGLAGSAIVTVGPSMVENSGMVAGGGDVAIQFGDADDTLILRDGSVISGFSSGAGGFDRAILDGSHGGPSPLRLVSGLVGFEQLNLIGGDWTAPGDTGSFDTIGIENGSLLLTGVIAGQVSINGGGTLTGDGTATGDIVVNTGGVLSPGTSLGTMIVAGNVHFRPGSTFTVDANAFGQADKLIATGHALIDGGQVQVLAQNGRYLPFTGYTVLTTGGGISGRFDAVSTDLAFLAPTLLYTDASVHLVLTRNDIPFAAVALNRNQERIARALETLNRLDPLVRAVLHQNTPGAQAAFTALSGAAHGDIITAVLGQAANMGLQFAAPLPIQSSGLTFWNRIDNRRARLYRQAGHSANLSLESGMAMAADGLAVSFVGGRTAPEMLTPADGAAAAFSSNYLAATVRYQEGALTLLGGGGVADHRVNTSRAVIFPGFAESLTGRYDARSRHLFGEISYRLGGERMRFIPYFSLANVAIEVEEFGEQGGWAALQVGPRNRQLLTGAVGFRAGGVFDIGGVLVTPHLDLSIRRHWSDGGFTTDLAFLRGTGGFAIQEDGADGHSLGVNAGATAQIGGAELSLGYRRTSIAAIEDEQATLSMRLAF